MKGESVNFLQHVDFNCKLYQRCVGDLFEKVLLGVFEEINSKKQTRPEETSQDKPLNDSYMSTLLSVLHTIPNHQIKVNGEQLSTDIIQTLNYASEGHKSLQNHQTEINGKQLSTDIPKNPELHTIVAKGETLAEDLLLQKEALDDVGLKPHGDFRTVEGRLSGFTEAGNTEVKAEILPKVREVFGISGEKAEKDQMGETLKPLPETPMNTIRFEEYKAQGLERTEKTQPQPSYEQKRIIVRLEEGNVKFMFSGDRLRLSINLNEDFYRQPTAYEVQRLVQSIQSLGFNLEVIKLNGNSLYNSEHRHGSKREGKEKQFFVNEPLDGSTKSFSLYL